MTRVPLTDEEYRLFREWLVQEYGLWFGPERREILRTRLEPRRAALGSATFQDLYFHLKFHPEREAERFRLIPHLTNNESYFFRERGQLEVFRTEVLPALWTRLRAEKRRELHVLSMGCAAGQEVYTLAILLHEAQVPTGIQPRIRGLDLDPQVLEQARAGRFTAHSFRGVGSSTRDRYFREDPAGVWAIEPRLRSAVEFQQANLLDTGWPAELPPQDVVFCRNVLIYFNAESLRRAAQGLHSALAPGGYLFLGHAETLSRVPTPLRAERFPGAVIYRRPQE